jgi:hypothetical protein
MSLNVRSKPMTRWHIRAAKRKTAEAAEGTIKLLPEYKLNIILHWSYMFS